MNASQMQSTPTPIDTTVPFVAEAIAFGTPNFIDPKEASVFMEAPKTPVKPKKKLECPGAPERKRE